MNIVTIILSWIFLSVICCAKEVDAKTSLGIRFYSPKGWSLNVMPNGSGSLAIGSLPTDVAFFPEKSLNYKELYEAVVPLLKEDNSTFEKESLAVIVLEENKTSYTALYFKGFDCWNEMIRKVKDKLSAHEDKRFKMLLLKTPPELKASE